VVGPLARILPLLSKIEGGKARENESRTVNEQESAEGGGVIGAGRLFFIGVTSE